MNIKFNMLIFTTQFLVLLIVILPIVVYISAGNCTVSVIKTLYSVQRFRLVLW